MPATSVRPAPAGDGRDGSVMLAVLVLHAGCGTRRFRRLLRASPRRAGTISEQAFEALLGGGCREPLVARLAAVESAQEDLHDIAVELAAGAGLQLRAGGRLA